MNIQRGNNNIGFTLMEVMVVIIIVAAMASFVVPKYNTYVTYMKSQEAKNVLLALWNAQMEYRRDNEGNYADNLGSLDIIEQADHTKYFQDVSVSNGTIWNCPEGEDDNKLVVARMQSKQSNPTFFLGILEDGKVVCTDDDDDGCDSDICRSIGYKADW